MTIQQLEYFMKTAELLNLTRVSEALHVSQPTVSYAIRELEKQFGITLFKRSSSGLKLTPEGILFMEKAKQLLQHFNSFENSFLNLGTEQLTVRLGVISLYASILPVVYRYGEEHDLRCGRHGAGRREAAGKPGAGGKGQSRIPEEQGRLRL